MPRGIHNKGKPYLQDNIRKARENINNRHYLIKIPEEWKSLKWYIGKPTTNVFPHCKPEYIINRDNKIAESIYCLNNLGQDLNNYYIGCMTGYSKNWIKILRERKEFTKTPDTNIKKLEELEERLINTLNQRYMDEILKAFPIKLDTYKYGFSGIKKIPKMKILKFSASWCASCKRLSENIKQLPKEYQEIFVELDVEKENQLSELYEVKSVPTLIVLNEDNEEINRSLGLLSVKQLEAYCESPKVTSK